MSPKSFVAWVAVLAGLTLASWARAEETDRAMDACTDHLRLINQALVAYERDNHRMPDQLSALYPKYIADKSIFHCPADPTDGSPGRDFLHKDPAMAMSYAYEWSADPSHGLPQPLGPFPGGWGSCAHLCARQSDFFGDQVPVVRCFHHKPDYSDEQKVLNLTRSGRIYRSLSPWEDHPESFATVIDRAGRDLLAGPQQFNKNWYVGALDGYCYDKIFSYGRLERNDYEALKPKYAQFADKLLAVSSALGPGRDRAALRLAAKFYNAAGKYQQGLDAIRRSIHLGVQEGEYAPDKWEREIEQDATVLRDSYEGLGQAADELALLVLMHGYKPTIGSAMNRLADVQDKIGNSQSASAWRDQAEPSRLLIGKPAPPFALPTPDGRTLSLDQLRSGKKATLVSFFFYGCGPCRAEAPHLETCYEKYKARGLQVVSIDLGDTKENVEQFVSQFKLTFPVLMGGDERQDHADVFSRFGVKGYPTLFLLDAQGRVVWHHVGFGDELRTQLDAELNRLGVR
jgi:peroxiredoxin